MKIVFFSSTLNHHQMPLCKAFLKTPGIEFVFVAMGEPEQQRSIMGYPDYNRAEFVLRIYESTANYERAHKLALESDVMIAGVFPDKFLQERLKKGKLTFLYRERIFKEKPTQLRFIKTTIYNWLKFWNYKKENLFILCASAYTAMDYHRMGLFKDRCIRWGYFPERCHDEYLDTVQMKTHNQKTVKMLWAGRFIDYKKPKTAIEICGFLNNKGYGFELNMVGIGPQKDVVKELAEKCGIGEHVNFPGSMSPILVREYMKESDFFLFTSNREEGWGAVVNEAMSCGCIVAGSLETGAVPFLVKDYVNGLVFHCDDSEEAAEKIIKVIEDRDLRHRISQCAYQTIQATWNEEYAVKNFLEFCNKRLTNCNDAVNMDIADDGPMSPIYVKDRWKDVLQ